MGEQLRTGVVLQFVARRSSHGSGLGLLTHRDAEHLGRQLLPSDGSLDAVSDGVGERVRPLPDRLRRDADGFGRKLGGAPEEIDGGGLVHAQLKHASTKPTSILPGSESILSHMGEENASTTFGDRLAIALGTTPREALAKELGISVSAIGQAIRGVTKAFTAENTAIAARFLGVDWYWLATGRGSPRAVHADESEEPVLSALREIKRLNPGTHEQLLSRVTEIADGLKAADNLLHTPAAPRPERETLRNPDVPVVRRSAR